MLRIKTFKGNTKQEVEKAMHDFMVKGEGQMSIKIISPIESHPYPGTAVGWYGIRVDCTYYFFTSVIVYNERG